MDKYNYENEYEQFDPYEEETDEGQKLSSYSIHRRMQKNQMERKVRQSEMWLRRFHFFVGFCITILLFFIGYHLLKLPQWYLDKNVFNSLDNPSLEILNNKIVPSYKILAALRRSELRHTPIYRLDTEELRTNIMRLEPVQNIYIRRFWFPARLQIIVEERTPIITIAPALNVAPIAFFAKGGKLIGRDYMPLPTSFKTNLVLSYGSKGDDYRNWDSEKVALIEKIAKAVKLSSNEDVEYIDLRNPKDVYVKIKTANLRLGDLDDTVFERISRTSSILPQIKTLNKQIKYVDLRWKNANYIKLAQ